LDAANGIPAKFRGVRWAEQARPRLNHEAQGFREPVRAFESQEDQVSRLGILSDDLEEG
jgi:hypothetical protein